MQRDVKVGLVLGVLLVAVVAVVFFRRDDEDRDKFAKLLPGPEAVADKAREVLGSSPSDPYPVGSEFVADTWQSSKSANSARTPTPQRNKSAEPAPLIESVNGLPGATQAITTRPSAVLRPPQFEPARSSPKDSLEPTTARARSGADSTSRSGRFTEYTIQEGDTLSGIASRFLGSGSLWPVIYQENENTITDPGNIPVGKKIRIPVLNRPERTASSHAPAHLQPPARTPLHNHTGDSYVVQQGDTLIRIARERYGRDSMYLEILRANQDQLTTAGDLQPGMILKLPQ